GLRYWDDKPAAPVRKLVDLRYDFVAQVPRQDNYVVGAAFLDLIRGQHRNPRSRQQQALLVDVAIDRIGDEVTTDPTVVEQCIALCRRAIGCDRLAILDQPDKETKQRSLQLTNPMPEGLVSRKPVEAGKNLLPPQVSDRAFHRHASGMRSVEPKRPTMG